MRFSVLMSFYKSERYLDQCLQSIENQTFSDWEIVLIDNGSSDRSAEIAKAHQDRFGDKIQVIRFDDNVGAFMAWALGTEATRGEIVVSLDADDMLVNTALETINDAFCENEDADAIMYEIARDPNSSGWQANAKRRLFYMTPPQSARRQRSTSLRNNVRQTLPLKELGR